MDGAHDVDALATERLRQGVLHTSRMLEHDVERLQEVVRERAERARDVFRAPRFVMRQPVVACALTAVAGFLLARARARQERQFESEAPHRVVSRPNLRELGLAVAARTIESLVARGFRI